MVPGQPHSSAMKTEKATTIEVGSFVTVKFFLVKSYRKGTCLFYMWLSRKAMFELGVAFGAATAPHK
jgi:hypothetical protein